MSLTLFIMILLLVNGFMEYDQKLVLFIFKRFHDTWVIYFVMNQWSSDRNNKEIMERTRNSFLFCIIHNSKMPLPTNKN